MAMGFLSRALLLKITSGPPQSTHASILSCAFPALALARGRGGARSGLPLWTLSIPDLSSCVPLPRALASSQGQIQIASKSMHSFKALPRSRSRSIALSLPLSRSRSRSLALLPEAEAEVRHRLPQSISYHSLNNFCSRSSRSTHASMLSFALLPSLAHTHTHTISLNLALDRARDLVRVR